MVSESCVSDYFLVLIQCNLMPQNQILRAIVLHTKMAADGVSVAVAWYKLVFQSYEEKAGVFKMPGKVQNALAVVGFHQRTQCN